MASRFPIHNERSPEQWEIIKDIDFGDTVVDFGCGYADLLFRIAQQCEVDYLIGVEENPSIVFRNMDIAEKGFLNVQFHNEDIMDWIEVWETTGNDIDTAICFSVLPYFDVGRPDYFLAWLANNAKQSLIECQYRGDGPGFDGIEDDYDMADWLRFFWDDYEPIGRTTVDYRGVDRTIWICRS